MKDLYSNSWKEENFSANYEDAYWQIQQLENQIRKLKKKKKKSGKKGKGKKKHQLQKRIRTLELEYQQLKQFTFFLAYQCKEQFVQQPWWQGAICNTLPKAFELATATINKLPDKTRPLYITDGSDRK